MADSYPLRRPRDDVSERVLHLDETVEQTSRHVTRSEIMAASLSPAREISHVVRISEVTAQWPSILNDSYTNRLGS
jgi:hypothetical protein